MLMITFLILKIIFSTVNVFAENDVEFFFYNKLNSNATQIYIGDIDSIKEFQTNRATRIIIHGWKARYDLYPTNVLRDAYLKKENLNIIVVRWKKALIDDYFLVTTYLKETGKIISDMILFLNEKCDIKFSNIYLIGHSLGAHIAGLSGRYLLPNKVDTIFALDPARFLQNNEDFIKQNDAEFIEVIHTNMQRAGVGIREAIGNSDFYPNYGKIQPHCEKESNTIRCDHLAAILYLAESINSYTGFYGIECNQIQKLERNVICECTDKCQKFRMGGEPSLKENKLNGSYYMETNPNSPFARG